MFTNDKQDDVEMLRQLRRYICDKKKDCACSVFVQ